MHLKSFCGVFRGRKKPPKPAGGEKPANRPKTGHPPFAYALKRPRTRFDGSPATLTWGLPEKDACGLLPARPRRKEALLERNLPRPGRPGADHQAPPASGFTPWRRSSLPTLPSFPVSSSWQPFAAPFEGHRLGPVSGDILVASVDKRGRREPMAKAVPVLRQVFAWPDVLPEAACLARGFHRFPHRTRPKQSAGYQSHDLRRPKSTRTRHSWRQQNRQRRQWSSVYPKSVPYSQACLPSVQRPRLKTQRHPRPLVPCRNLVQSPKLTVSSFRAAGPLHFPPGRCSRASPRPAPRRAVVGRSPRASGPPRFSPSPGPH